MYAVIKTGGKQYRVQAGDMLVVDKLDGEAGAVVAFDQVLMLGAGDAVVVGAPTVAGAVVNATLVETRKGVKIKVFKKIRRQGYRRTLGHRQHETVLRVTGISGEGHAETWDGVIDFTTRAELNARARGLTFVGGTPKADAETKAKPIDAEPVADTLGADSERTVVEQAAAEAPAKKPAAKKKAAAKPAAESTKVEGDDA